MSYGLYISDGVNGGVITNSNTVLNEEFSYSLTATLAPSASTSVQFSGAGNSALVGVTFSNASPERNDLSISRNSSTDTLTITNGGASSVTFTADFFRFG